MRFGRVVSVVLVSLSAAHSGAGAVPLFRGVPLIFDVGEDEPGRLPEGDQTVAAVADLNGDGRDDIVVGNPRNPINFFAGSTVSVLLGATGPAIPSVLRPKTNWPIVPEFKTLHVRDFNNDGKPDLLTGTDSTLMLFAGDGAGGFSPTHVDTGVHYFYTSVLTGDLNGDGILDVLLGYLQNFSSAHRAFLGTGTGSFTEGPETYVSYSKPMPLVDVTGDGRLDLIGWNPSQNQIMVGVGSGNGSFNSPIYSTLSTLSGSPQIRAGDFDEDSTPDLVVTDGWQPVVTVLHGSGNGAFSEISTTNLPQNDQAEIAVRDMDLDGHLDVVLTFNHINNTTMVGKGVNSAAVMFGDGTGQFPSVRMIDGGGDPWPVILGDFDGNGLPDIATTSFFDIYPNYPSAHAVTVSLNEGNRQFGGTHLATSHPPESEAVADMNRDGIPDLLVSNNSAEIEVRLGNAAGGYGAVLTQPLTPANSASRFAVGDVNRDGKLDIAASGVSLLLGNGDGTFTNGSTLPVGTTTEESLIDLNRDGVLDLVQLGPMSLNVQLGLANGTFGSGRSYALPTAGRDFHVDDWNRDGKPDVAVATQAGILLFAGTASGALNLSATIQPTRAFTDVTSGDYNRDGWPDLAGRDEYYDGAPADAGGASVYLADGAGGFGPRSTLPAFDRPGFEIASWDVNRDGSPDIVGTSRGEWVPLGDAGHTTCTTASVWLGNGAGVFRHDSNYFIGMRFSVNRVSFGDLNRDGQTDIIGGNEDWPTETTALSYVSLVRGAMPPFSGQFGGHVEYGASSGPGALSVADFNRDGRLDVAGIGGTMVEILLGNGGGALTSFSSIYAGNGVVAGDAADLDRDGDQDLVTITNTGGCSLLINDGQGQFSSIPIGVGSDVTDLALGDLNRDGIPDLVVCDTAAGAIVVKMGTGAPGFGDPVAYFPSNGGVHVTLGDVNRDGWLDVVVDDPWLGNAAIFVNNGLGGLLESAYVAIGDGSRDILLADVNRDGRLDIVATRSSGGPRLTVLLANGMGGFNSPTNYVLYNDLRGLSMGDVDADGIADVLVAANDGLLVLRGNGSGFPMYEPYTTGIGEVSVVQADLDRDGRPDLIAAGGMLNVSVLLGSDAAPTGIPVAAAPATRATLSQNRPNPFNPRTEIRFSLAKPAPVRLRIFDAAGRTVITLADGPLAAGEHRVSWDGRTGAGAAAASGVYFYRLETSGFTDSRRMVLLR